MSEELASGFSSPALERISRSPLTRRQMLRTMAATGFVTAGGAVLAACGGPANGSSDITLVVSSGGYFSPLPSEVKKTDSARARAQATVIQDWLNKHPNVKLKTTSIKIDTAQALQTAILGHQAPAQYGLTTLGAMDVQHAAAGLGLAADVTDLYHKYNVDSLLADYAKPLWNSQYDFSGRYYGMPSEVINAGFGVLLRRDILTQHNLIEPDALNWTWEQYAQLAKQLKDINNGKPASAGPPWLIGYFENSSLLDPYSNGLLGAVPAPGTGNTYHWKADVTNWSDNWKRGSQLYRSMTTDDKSLLISPSFNEFTLMQQFAAGQYALVPTIGLFAAFISGQSGSVAQKIKTGGTQAYDETVAYLPFPNGDNGAWNPLVEPQLGANAYYPKLSTDALDAAVNLYLYMYFQDGYVDTRYRTYLNANHDVTSAYDYVAPSNRYQNNPKLPAGQGVIQVFGPRMVETTMRIIGRSIRPNLGVYLPKAETKTGPTSDALHDFQDKLGSGSADVDAALKAFQDTYNQQAAGLPSDLSPSEFRDGAQKWLKALDDYWRVHSPKFYQGDWNKYYHQLALPALQG